MIVVCFLLVFLTNVVSCAPAIGRSEFVEPRMLVTKHLQVQPFTGQIYFTDLTKIKQPTPVRRVRILMTGKTHVAGSRAILTAFHFRVRWVPPEFWFDGYNERNRSYNLICIAEDQNTMHVQEFLNIKIGGDLSAYEENFLINDLVQLMIRCRIRARNSAGLYSKWFPSERLFLRTYKTQQN